MNGFIYLEGAGESGQSGPDRVFPLRPGAKWEECSFARGERLLTWGYASGDVHYCVNGTESLLVLCGYISEIRSGPELANQKQAANFLRESIERDNSLGALTALLERLHGSFSIFYRHFRKGHSFCLTDRMASRPLWRLWTGTGWRVSSHAIAIASASPSVKVEPGALGAFLLYGGPVEPRKSVFAGIEAVPPGAILRLSQAGDADEARWYRFRHDPDERLRLTDWIDLAAERLVRSASRLTRQCGRPAVFFSGGVDSRLTAAALKAAGAKPLLVTLGDTRNLEVRVSEQAARALDLQHVVILRDEHWYLQDLPEAVFETGGAFVWSHGHFSRAISKLRGEHGIEVFFLGDLCEAFSKLLCSGENGTLWSPEEFVRDFDRARMPDYRPKHKDRTLALLNPEVRKQAETVLSQDILGRYRGMAGVTRDPRIMVDHFSRWESVATIATFHMFLDVRSAAAERNLMFDKEVHELLEQLPSHLREGANLGALLVKRLAPRASKVVNSNSLLPLCWPTAAHKLSRKCKPLLGKARRFILGDSHRTTGAWPKRETLYASDPTWRGYFDKVLGSEALFTDGLFDRERVRQCWAAFLEGEHEFAGDIEKLVQFSLMSQARRSGFNGAGAGGSSNPAF